MKKFAFEEMIHYHIQEIGIKRRRNQTRNYHISLRGKVRARGPRRRKEFVFEEMMSHSHIQAKGEQERARGTQDKK